MMLTLKMIKDWIKTICIPLGAKNFYIGKLENKNDMSIGVYQLQRENAPYIALGGLENTSYFKKAISILIHWNDNQDDIEVFSSNLYKKLEELQSEFMIEDVKIKYLELLVNEPVDVGSDSNGIYEMVIQAVFYYERS